MQRQRGVRLSKGRIFGVFCVRPWTGFLRVVSLVTTLLLSRGGGFFFWRWVCFLQALAVEVALTSSFCSPLSFLSCLCVCFHSSTCWHTHRRRRQGRMAAAVVSPRWLRSCCCVSLRCLDVFHIFILLRSSFPALRPCCTCTYCTFATLLLRTPPHASSPSHCLFHVYLDLRLDLHLHHHHRHHVHHPPTSPPVIIDPLSFAASTKMRSRDSCRRHDPQAHSHGHRLEPTLLHSGQLCPGGAKRELAVAICLSTFVPVA